MSTPAELGALLAAELDRGPRRSPTPRVGGASARATVRVFVSSTFADFYLERELLATWVAQELRGRCAAANLDFVLIDLKFGVPGDAHPTEYCMRQLAECVRANGAPYLLFLCGSRRGWVPAAADVPPSLRCEPVEWVDGVSITVMEFLFGAGRGGGNVNALFCLRAPAFAESMKRVAHEGAPLPSNWPVGAVPKPACAPHGFEESETLQAALRAHVARSFPPSAVVNYDPLPGGDGTELDFKPFIDSVIEGLWSRITAQYPSPSGVEGSSGEGAAARLTPNISRDTLALQDLQHEAVLAAVLSADGAAPRVDATARLVDAVDTAARMGGVVLLRGDSGAGKSTLLAQVVGVLRARGSCAVVAHFVGLADRSSDAGALARRIVAGAWRARSAAPGAASADTTLLPADTDEACSLARHTLSSWRADDWGALCVTIDAVNQMHRGGEPADIAWLPAAGALPSGVTVLISTTPTCTVAAMLAVRVDTALVAAVPMGAAEARAVLAHSLAVRHGKALSPSESDAIAALEPGFRNPLWQYLAVEMLATVAISMTGRADVADLPSRTDALLAATISHAETSCDRLAVYSTSTALVRALLLAACASPSGLRESEAFAAVPAVAAALEIDADSAAVGVDSTKCAHTADATLLTTVKSQRTRLLPFQWMLVHGAANALLRKSAPGAEVLVAPAHALVIDAVVTRYGARALAVTQRALAAFYEASDAEPSRRATEAPALYAALGDKRALARSLACAPVVALAASGAAECDAILAWARAAGGGEYDAAAAALDALIVGLDARVPLERSVLFDALKLLSAMSRSRPALWRSLVDGAAPLLDEGGLAAADLLIAAAPAMQASPGAMQDMYIRAIEVRTAHLGAAHTDVADALLAQAGHMKDLPVPDRDGAGALYARARSIIEAGLGGAHPRLAHALASEAYWHLRRREYDDAHALLERAARILADAYGPDHSALAGVHFSRGSVFSEEQRWPEATAQLRAALRIRLVTVGEDTNPTATVEHDLARVLRAAGGAKGHDEAIDLCRRSLATRRKLHSRGSDGVAATLESLAALLRDAGRVDEAAAAFEEALAVRRGRDADDGNDVHRAFWDAGGRGNDDAFVKRGGWWGAIVCAACDAAPIRGVRIMCCDCCVDLCASCNAVGAAVAGHTQAHRAIAIGRAKGVA